MLKAMHLDLPERLTSTRDLLTRSMPTHPIETAPPMPAGLASDLAARFAPKVAAPPVSANTTWFDRVRSFLATPGFGAVAVAVVVVGIAVPLFSGGKPEARESFRGAETTASPVVQTRIFFIGENTTALTAIENSGNFEASALVKGASAEAAQAAAGPKVVVDFASGTVTAYDAGGTEVSKSELSADGAKATAAVVKAVSGL